MIKTHSLRSLRCLGFSFSVEGFFQIQLLVSESGSEVVNICIVHCFSKTIRFQIIRWRNEMKWKVCRRVLLKILMYGFLLSYLYLFLKVASQTSNMIPEVNSNRFEISNHCENAFCSLEYLISFFALQFFESCLAKMINFYMCN